MTVPACALPGNAITGEPGHPGDVVEATSEAVQGLVQTSTVTTRGVVATPNALDDWGSDRMIDPGIVASGALVVRYCAQHFPPGSAALANLTTAVNTYSAVAAVAIDLDDLDDQPGTATHPDLATFTLPSNAIYVDYSDSLASTTFASAAFASCDASTPMECTRARIYINADSVTSDTDFFNPDVAPSVGVFMHELGHVFGMKHLNEDDDSGVLNNPANMGFDLTTIHGNKLASNDFRHTVIHAATLAFLRAHYGEVSAAPLATDELVAHRNMSLADPDVPMHIEFNPSKTYKAWGSGGSLITDKNETKLRWNPTAENGSGGLGAFEPCTAPGTLPRWFARMSETSTSTVNRPFQAAFMTSTDAAGTAWSVVAERTFDSYVVGQAELRQIDWEKTFPISAADVGVVGGAGVAAITTRKLRFQVDSSSAIDERNESNNEWRLNLCLYPASNTTCQNTTVVCAQP